jgi:hypothetical protein
LRELRGGSAKPLQGQVYSILKYCLRSKDESLMIVSSVRGLGVVQCLFQQTVARMAFTKARAAASDGPGMENVCGREGK